MERAGTLNSRPWLPIYSLNQVHVRITIAVIIGLVYYIQKMAKESRLLGVSLALMLGGAIGNFIDRVVRQEVVDFVHTYIFSYSFPVFNVADAALSIGVGLLVIHMFLEEKNAKE